MISTISALAVRRSGASAVTVTRRQLTDLQRDRQLDLLADLQRQPLLFEPFEAGKLDRQLVVADRQRRQKEASLRIGDPFGLEATRHMKRLDVGAGHDRALHIFDDA